MSAAMKRVPECLRKYVEGPQGSSYLEAALTRRAWILERGGPDLHDHESLEWLGDRILGAVVAQELWRRFPYAEPGKLDLLRNELTSEAPLVELAAELELLSYIRMGAGESSQGQASTPKALSSHMEAVIGAVFKTGGWPAAEEIINLLLKDRYPTRLPADGHRVVAIDGSNAMTALNERVQQRWRNSGRAITWDCVRVGGADNAPIHQATVTLPDGSSYVGEVVRGTKKEAQASAARVALAAGDW